MNTSRPFRALLLTLLAASAPVHAQDRRVAFEPPDEDTVPDDAFGRLVREGKDLFVNTQTLRGRYVGNGLRCVNCHLDAGRRANSSPLWAAYTMYPAFRGKTGRVDTFDMRVQGCFVYSMNGKAPPPGSRELTALTVYAYWLATNAPVGVSLPGRGYPQLDKPAEAPDIRRGADVFAQKCALCHGADALGTQGTAAMCSRRWRARTPTTGARACIASTRPRRSSKRICRSAGRIR